LVSVNADLATNEEKKAAQSFKKETKDQKLYSSGKAPPKDGKALNWMNDVINEPQPLTLKLAPIDKLDVLRTYLEKKPKVVKNIKTALSDYCEHLKGQGKVSSCQSPNPNNLFPKSKYFLIKRAPFVCLARVLLISSTALS
jgi:hypothetical protein